MLTGSLQLTSYYTVRLYLRGRAPVEFIGEKDSPTLLMLQRCIARESHQPDELVYLNYGESATDGLYFMASSLTSLELSPVAV